MTRAPSVPTVPQKIIQPRLGSLARSFPASVAGTGLAPAGGTSVGRASGVLLFSIGSTEVIGWCGKGWVWWESRVRSKQCKAWQSQDDRTDPVPPLARIQCSKLLRLLNCSIDVNRFFFFPVDPHSALQLTSIGTALRFYAFVIE